MRFLKQKQYQLDLMGVKMKYETMRLSINPTYLCNFRCSFCYLTEDQLSDRKLCPIDLIKKRFLEVKAQAPIEHVDLYGGEVSLLPEEYLNELFDFLKDQGVSCINVITNFSKVSPVLLDDRTRLSVSFDFSARQMHEQVFINMMTAPKPISVLILASPEVLKMNVDDMISQLNMANNIISVEIKPYSSNQSNQLNVDYTQFEEFVKRWITSPVEKKFFFTNEGRLVETVTGTANSFSDEHLYITPHGKLAVLDFDENDNEYFQDLDSWQDYQEWCKNERQKVLSNQFCGACPYVGQCLSEHLRDVKSIDKSCNGFINLIKWYDQEIWPNKTEAEVMYLKSDLVV